MQNRAMIFIDGANLISGWRAYCLKKGHFDKVTDKITQKLDYEKLISLLTTQIKETELIRAYFFDGLMENDPKKGKFLDKLRSLEMSLVTSMNKTKTKTCPHCKKIFAFDVQKGVDVSLATYVLGLAFEDAYDIAIIVSGDGDYEQAIKFIKNKGKNVWVVAFRGSLSADLWKCADKIVELDSHFEKLRMSDGSSFK
ncbi:MAG: NYN domain-containing protein [Candidatus Diapherotrites archaeon]|nr:NYN domain-containing protein [Candidatus Diapherotrites archaeon]